MLVITLGDPHGVTVELAAAVLAAGRPFERLPVVLVGSAWQWRDQVRRLGSFAPLMMTPLPPMKVSLPGVNPGVQNPVKGLYFADVGTPADARAAESLSEPERGALARRALDWLKGLPAQPWGPENRLAVVTGPIDKHACAAAGFAHPGQTEFFEALWGSQAVMTLAGPRLRVGLVTNHLALKDVPAHINALNVVTKARLFVTTLRESFGIMQPRVAVCGLNPHAGDQGLFGDEDAQIIAPAIAAVQEGCRAGAVLTGPLAADTVFYRAMQGEFDGVLAMYHDQALGPLKTVHFDDAVNLSGGLPHFRASPDHGPARDLFLKGRASPKSFAAAVDLAARYLETP